MIINKTTLKQILAIKNGQGYTTMIVFFLGLICITPVVVAQEAEQWKNPAIISDQFSNGKMGITAICEAPEGRVEIAGIIYPDGSSHIRPNFYGRIRYRFRFSIQDNPVLSAALSPLRIPVYLGQTQRWAATVPNVGYPYYRNGGWLPGVKPSPNATLAMPWLWSSSNGNFGTSTMIDCQSLDGGDKYTTISLWSGPWDRTRVDEFLNNDLFRINKWWMPRQLEDF